MRRGQGAKREWAPATWGAGELRTEAAVQEAPGASATPRLCGEAARSSRTSSTCAMDEIASRSVHTIGSTRTPRRGALDRDACGCKKIYRANQDRRGADAIDTFARSLAAAKKEKGTYRENGGAIRQVGYTRINTLIRTDEQTHTNDAQMHVLRSAVGARRCGQATNTSVMLAEKRYTRHAREAGARDDRETSAAVINKSDAHGISAWLRKWRGGCRSLSGPTDCEDNGVLTHPSTRDRRSRNK